jgi:RHS repeat-associated protein
VSYLHGDHLGSISVTTTASGTAEPRQEFDPWGTVRSGGVTTTTRNYTGQILDDTGLLFYNARYYDPAIGRFISGDTVVPGSPSGTMNGVAVKPLTVSFHESGFRSKLNSESKAPFWFQMDGDAKQQHGSPLGPANPQALNRYAYVQNNPLKYTDPTGHTVYYDHAQAEQYIQMLRNFAANLRDGAAALLAATTLGAVVTAITALFGPLGAAIAALFAGEIAMMSYLLTEFANQIDQFADLIEKYNGDNGVSITADCVGRLLSCNITIYSQDTGHGTLMQTGRGVAAKLMWNAVFDVNMIHNPDGRSPYESGVSYNFQHVRILFKHRRDILS